MSDKKIVKASSVVRSELFITIDSENTRDIDDALYAERTDDGYRVLVAIANPTKLVVIGSTEDEQARLIAATAYIRDRAVRKMLPGVISEFKGSLVANQERSALVFEVHLTPGLDVQSFSMSAATIKVAHRLSYSEIPVIVKDSTHPAHVVLSVATTMATLMLKARRNRGALALYDLSRLLLTDEDGNVRVLHSVEEVIGQILIQETMILVNHLAAKYLVENNIPCILRNHEPRLAAPASNELALTIEGWIKGDGFDESYARAQFAAIAGRARYGATAKGHYGLSLPFYTHISSPLRRYADLVNMRQIIAHLSKKPFPYTQEQLVTLCEDLNDALERRKEERSEGFKDVVKRTAEQAIEKGALSKLADHELRQAVKLSREAGYLPELVVDELVDRFARATISDSLADTLMTEIPDTVLTDSLRAAIAKWLAELPPKAMHMLLHAQQTGFLSEVDIQAGDASAGFSARARALCADGRRFEATASGTKKREAEQAAAAGVIGQIMRLPSAPTNAGASRAPVAAVGENFKGRLLECCQQAKWPTPTFESSGKGPSHAMIFSASARVTVRGKEYVASAAGAATKKEAEMLASRDLLEQIVGLAKTPQLVTPTNAALNPIGVLQEMAQKQKAPIPTYEVLQVRETPPNFICTVTVHVGTMGQYKGEGVTKQIAKGNAAAAALAAERECSRTI